MCSKIGKYLNFDAKVGLITIGILCLFIDLWFRTVNYTINLPSHPSSLVMEHKNSAFQIICLIDLKSNTEVLSL